MSAEPVFDLRDLLGVVRRRIRFVLGVTVGAAALTLGIAFLLPQWYLATAVILPPEESDLLSNMSIASRALTKFPAFGILGDYFTPADIYKAILGSRTAQEALVDEFDLQKRYNLKSREKTLKELTGHTRVKLNPDGTIAVSVEDRNPQRAADMTNAYIAELDRFNLEKRSSSARRTREFLQRRVAETDSLLRLSEARLREYQERKQTIAPASAGSEATQAAADLMSRKIMLEVQLGMLRGYLREDNDQVIQARSELDQLNRRIGALPELVNDMQRLVRDSKMYEQLYLLLASELERARVRETMDTPTVQVLDFAHPPERHSRPRKGLLAAGAGLLAFFMASAWTILRDRPRLPAAE